MQFVFFSFPSGECRTLRFHSAMKGHYLKGHVFKSIAVREERTCGVKCYIEDNCVSYNIASSPGDGTMLCELSNSDHEMHPEDLKRRFGSIYQPFEVSFLKQ